MQLKVTQTYQASDIKFLQVYKFAEGVVDIQLQFVTDNPFEPVQISFTMDKDKCKEMAENLLSVVHKLEQCKPPKFEGVNTEELAEEEGWQTCRRCQERYDETKGDGYLGLCPKCADETDPPE